MLPKQGLFLGDRQALLAVEMAETLVKGEEWNLAGSGALVKAAGLTTFPA